MADQKPEKQDSIRPTKKQRELLRFIETFIKQHGYSPSYREIMRGLNYTSVATVALHVNSLVTRGHLQKRDNSARSLEVLDKKVVEKKIGTNQVKESEEKWLVNKIDHYFKIVEQDANPPEAAVDKLYVLVASLKVLDLEGAANSFMPRLSAMKEKMDKR